MHIAINGLRLHAEAILLRLASKAAIRVSDSADHNHYIQLAGALLSSIVLNRINEHPDRPRRNSILSGRNQPLFVHCVDYEKR